MLERDQSVITVIVLGHSAFRGLFCPSCGVIPGKRNSEFALPIQRPSWYCQYVSGYIYANPNLVTWLLRGSLA